MQSAIIIKVTLIASSSKLAFLQATSPLNPLSKMERGLKPTRKIGFLPLLQCGEGGRGDEVQKLAIKVKVFIVSLHIHLTSIRHTLKGLF